MPDVSSLGSTGPYLHRVNRVICNARSAFFMAQLVIMIRLNIIVIIIIINEKINVAFSDF